VVVLAEELEPTLAGLRRRVLDGKAKGEGGSCSVVFLSAFFWNSSGGAILGGEL
jgi:hypothetical protein